VGFDINCGVRLLRTNLFEHEVQPLKEKIEIRLPHFFNLWCVRIAAPATALAPALSPALSPDSFLRCLEIF
jgi:hypothetical protein